MPYFNCNHWLCCFFTLMVKSNSHATTVKFRGAYHVTVSWLSFLAAELFVNGEIVQRPPERQRRVEPQPQRANDRPRYNDRTRYVRRRENMRWTTAWGSLLYSFCNWELVLHGYSCFCLTVELWIFYVIICTPLEMSDECKICCSRNFLVCSF